jgi:hypothetical protein
VEQTQWLLQKWDARAHRLYPRMEISRDGVTFSAGTVLAGMAKDERGRPRSTLDDEPRALALLATANVRLALSPSQRTLPISRFRQGEIQKDEAILVNGRSSHARHRFVYWIRQD